MCLEQVVARAARDRLLSEAFIADGAENQHGQLRRGVRYRDEPVETLAIRQRQTQHDGGYATFDEQVHALRQRVGPMDIERTAFPVGERRSNALAFAGIADDDGERGASIAHLRRSHAKVSMLARYL